MENIKVSIDVSDTLNKLIETLERACGRVHEPYHKKE